MKVLLALSLAAACMAAHAQSLSVNPLARYVYPLHPAKSTPEVKVDASDLPSQEAWGEQAASLVREWFPVITRFLSTQDWIPPKTITLVIKKKLDVPAYCTGDSISINGEWITQHPDDLGMVIHELVHVIQQYPDSEKTPGWLVEGVADYIRWWRYEPEAPRPKVDPAKNKYSDAYRVTGAFLAWASKKYNMALVPELDLAMREKRDPMDVFKTLTGKTAEELNTEWLSTYK